MILPCRLMFFFALFFASLLATHCFPIDSKIPLSPEIDSFSINTCDASNGDASNQRTTYGIVWSCLVTIFACVWGAVHPNLPGPYDGTWTTLKRRMLIMTCALIPPELMALWALRQRFGAEEIAKAYNTQFMNIPKKQPLDPHQTFCERFRKWSKSTLDWKLWREDMCRSMSDLPHTAARRDGTHLWTKTHGFFTQMGGFLLYENGAPLRVLTFEDLLAKIEDKSIDLPTITEAEIQDRSKGNALSKCVVVVQTSWFIVQCIARWASSLPLSELEIITLGFALLNGIVYGVWWDKPQAVMVATCIPLKKIGADNLITATSSRGSPATTANVPTCVSDTAGSTRNKNPAANANALSAVGDRNEDQGRIQRSWIPSTLALGYNKLQKYFERLDTSFNSSKYAMVKVPYHMARSIFRALWKMGCRSDAFKQPTRVPMFYADDGESFRAAYYSCAIGMLFGAVHLLGWAYVFPSHSEKVVWGVSAIIITTIPIMALIEIYKMQNIKVIVFFFIALYIMARCALVGIAFISLPSLPPQVFLPIQWTFFIPHF